MNVTELDAPTLALRQFVSNLVRALIEKGVFTNADAIHLLDNWFEDMVAIAARNATAEVDEVESIDDVLHMIHSLSVELNEPPNETPTPA